MRALSRFVLPGIVFLLTVATGFWVGYSGRPYSTLVMTVHKLLALGALIVAAVQVVRRLRAARPRSLSIVLFVLAALCAVALFASGALMSIGTLDYALALTLHRVAPAVLLLAMALGIYRLGKRP